MNKTSHISAILIAIGLLIIPFFWLAPGFVDLGGDAGRLYYLDPLSSALVKYFERSSFGATIYAFIPYELFLYVIKLVVGSPTNLISFERGLQIGGSFIAVYACVWQLVRNRQAAIAAGLSYVGFISKLNWHNSLNVHNQVFLNPLLFLLLLLFVRNRRFAYMVALVIITLLFSGNFGFSAMPQVLSFFPMAILSIVLLCRYTYKISVPWRGLLTGFVLFIGFHSFHIVPTVATIFEPSNSTNERIFNKDEVISSGVNYFKYNREALGKISTQIFQPAVSGTRDPFMVLIPGIIVAGFLAKRSYIQAIFGLFMLVTLFLSSANITDLGASVYEKLFYIPGFSMFRSFQEKWHFVYSFFCTVLFGVSFAYLFGNRWKNAGVAVFTLISVSLAYRTIPFLSGNAIREPLYQSNSVQGIFTPDSDLIEALGFVRALPKDGRFLTLPLTFPYYQVFYGQQGGAYVGISAVRNLAGADDMPGFWGIQTYGYEVSTFEALKENDIKRFTTILSMLNVKYIFHNSDPRIMDDFPGYPYASGGRIYTTKDQLPVIQDQSAYKALLAKLPIREIFKKGFYTIYEFSDDTVRPYIYVSDYYTKDLKKALDASRRSLFASSDICSTVACEEINNSSVDVRFTKLSRVKYIFEARRKDKTRQFFIVLSQLYHPSWELSLDSGEAPGKPIKVNNYANAWLIAPGDNEIIRGSIYFGIDRYYQLGLYISALSIGVLLIWILRNIYDRNL